MIIGLSLYRLSVAKEVGSEGSAADGRYSDQTDGFLSQKQFSLVILVYLKLLCYTLEKPEKRMIL